MIFLDEDLKPFRVVARGILSPPVVRYVELCVSSKVCFFMVAAALGAMRWDVLVFPRALLVADLLWCLSNRVKQHHLTGARVCCNACRVSAALIYSVLWRLV